MLAGLTILCGVTVMLVTCVDNNGNLDNIVSVQVHYQLDEAYIGG